MGLVKCVECRVRCKNVFLLVDIYIEECIYLKNMYMFKKISNE